MEPTLKDKKIVVMKKYNLELEYNDIVVIRKDSKIIIKRIVGLPYDTVKIDRYVQINGQKFDDILTENSGIASNNIILNKDEYFVLGDNRQNSIDSRFQEIGTIKRSEIIGKVIIFNK